MAATNQTITLKGNPVRVAGATITVQDSCPDFVVTGIDMAEFSLNAFAGKTLVILSVPSVDTPVCSVEAKRFSEEAKSLPKDIAVLLVSRDLPFAQKRWCDAEGVEQIRFGSDFKHRSFGKAFGVDLEDVGILARAAFVVDKQGKIVYADYVSEVAEEPDYEAILSAAKLAS